MRIPVDVLDTVFTVDISAWDAHLAALPAHTPRRSCTRDAQPATWARSLGDTIVGPGRCFVDSDCAIPSATVGE